MYPVWIFTLAFHRAQAYILTVIEGNKRKRARVSEEAPTELLGLFRESCPYL